VHTGRIYPGRRDPTPAFRAARELDGSVPLRFVFYGAQEERIVPLADACGVAHLVEVHGHVPYGESLAAQRAADILLFMQWNDPREQGNIPGKLFEYLAMRRPILGLGLEDGVPAAIIRERGAGFFGNDPRAIAARLRAWAEQKRTTGEIAPLPACVHAGLARDEQFVALEDFLAGLCAAPLSDSTALQHP
ncbi:MAG: glycosyltransferase, partial [Alphaproteobacteria bacterium]